MKSLEIVGETYVGSYDRIRRACRGIIVQDGKILLSHGAAKGLWMIPGGGLEAGESPEACCIREAEEETGLLVRPEKQFLILSEYYEEYRYISHYFVCAVTGKGTMRLTEQEKARAPRPEWIPLRDALGIFSRHREYAAVSEEKRGIYLREFTALTEYCDQCERERL